MVLSDADLERFQDIYREQFGKEISKEDAYEQGIKLLRLMAAVYRPMTQEEFDFIEKRRKSSPPLPEITRHDYEPK